MIVQGTGFLEFLELVVNSFSRLVGDRKLGRAAIPGRRLFFKKRRGF
jgi:hypothetical protein